MENSVWNQKYANEIKSKLDIAGKKGHLIANRNSERRNRRKRTESERRGHQWAVGTATDSLSPFNWGPRKLGENRKKKMCCWSEHRKKSEEIMAKCFSNLISRFKILNKPQVVKSLKKTAEKHTINKLVKTSEKKEKKQFTEEKR